MRAFFITDLFLYNVIQKRPDKIGALWCVYA